jgi:hypothetical protein
MSKYKNELNIPLSLAVYLATDNYDHSSDPNEISVTGLLKPLKQIILSSRLPAEEQSTDISALVTSRLGTSIHSGIEKAWDSNYKQAMCDLGYSISLINQIVINPDPNNLPEDCIPVYQEIRTKKQLGKYTISGKFDFVADGRIEDFKSTKVYSYIAGTNDEKYMMQGSIYRWLNPTIITNPEMAIQYIFMDWSSMQAMINSDYPKSAMLEKKFTLMPIPQVEQFITNKLNQIEKYANADESDMPACTDEDLWRRAPVWKYYKDPTKTARSTKNFDSAADAHVRLAEDGYKGSVVEVKGEVVACKYCSALSICKQKNTYILNETLKL